MKIKISRHDRVVVAILGCKVYHHQKCQKCGQYVRLSLEYDQKALDKIVKEGKIK